MKNRKNNKGFSLVELIVVVAIMAVLVGVLAPAYLKYVDKSRTNKDLTNGEEFRHAAEIALSDETVYGYLSTALGTNTKYQITVSDANDAATSTIKAGVTTATNVAADDNALVNEIVKTVGEKLNPSSKTYNGKDFVIEVTVSSGDVSVSGAYAQ